jgi:hypothetical protein
MPDINNKGYQMESSLKKLIQLKSDVSDLIRLGSVYDGGYVVSRTGLEKADVLYTYGVSDNFDFEKDFSRIYPNKTAKMFDPTVDVPTGNGSIIFVKEGLYANDGKCTTFEDHVARFGDQQRNIFLKIDTEGAEYPFFEAANASVFASVTAMAVEFHDLGNPDIFERFKSIIEKICRNYDIVHIHSNNTARLFDAGGLLLFPAIPEISFLRKDLNTVKKAVFRKFPLKVLDNSNTPGWPDHEFAIGDEMEAAFKHSGDLGDIIYSLPTIKRLGGGILYLDTTGGAMDPSCQRQCPDGRTKFDQKGYEFIRPLLIEQAYIKDVRVYTGQEITYNLNLFRARFEDPKSRSKTKNLLDLYLETFGLPEWDPDEGWLQIENPIYQVRKMVICRSPRYQANFSWLQSRRLIFQDNACFIGLEKEHDLFEWTFNIKLPYIDTPNALQMARVIAGSNKFIANSTLSLAIAVGLGNVSIIHEFDPRVPTTVFNGKKNMVYI